jgi:tRNA threonylcarbamoyladenosine biosynthesis protein TsaB
MDSAGSKRPPEANLPLVISSLRDKIGPRNLLVIDTSTDRTTVGVAARDGAVYPGASEPGAKHGRDLLPLIRELLARCGLAAGELQVVAVGLGPGSYTGLRIGLTAARVLAYAAGADLLGFDSLEGMARAAPGDATSVHVVADAQRGDVYAADFTRAARDGPLTFIAAARVEPLRRWSSRLGERALVLGPGLDSPRIAAVIPPGVAIAGPELRRPRAESLIGLALERLRSGRREDLWDAEPNYLRRSAAEDQWDARGPASP